MQKRLLRISGILFAFAAWEAISISGLVSQELMPRLHLIFAALLSFVNDPSFWNEVWLSTVRAAAGLAFAVLIAMGLAILSGRYARVKNMLEPLTNFLRGIPPPAIIPMLIFLVGLGEPLYLGVIAFGCIWPVYISASNALSAPEPVQIHTARIFGLSDWQTLWQVRLPAALPEAMTGLRLSSSIALLSAVATEMLMGGNGIGALIFNAGFNLLWDEMYALMIVIGILGIVFNVVVEVFRRSLSGWQVKLAKMGNAT